jgi:hypothetical protein
MGIITRDQLLEEEAVVLPNRDELSTVDYGGGKWSNCHYNNDCNYNSSWHSNNWNNDCNNNWNNCDNNNWNNNNNYGYDNNCNW